MNSDWITNLPPGCIKDFILEISAEGLVPCPFDEGTHALVLTEWFHEPHVELDLLNGEKQDEITFGRTGKKFLQAFSRNPSRAEIREFEGFYSPITRTMHLLCEQRNLVPTVKKIQRLPDRVAVYSKENRRVDRFLGMREKAWGLLFLENGETIYKTPDEILMLTTNVDMYPAFSETKSAFEKKKARLRKKREKQNEDSFAETMRVINLQEGIVEIDSSFEFYMNCFLSSYFLRKYGADIGFKKRDYTIRNTVRSSVRECVLVGACWIRKLCNMPPLKCMYPNRVKAQLKRDIESYAKSCLIAPRSVSVSDITIKDWVISDEGLLLEREFDPITLELLPLEVVVNAGERRQVKLNPNLLYGKKPMPKPNGGKKSIIESCKKYLASAYAPMQLHAVKPIEVDQKLLNTIRNDIKTMMVLRQYHTDEVYRVQENIYDLTGVSVKENKLEKYKRLPRNPFKIMWETPCIPTMNKRLHQAVSKGHFIYGRIGEGETKKERHRVCAVAKEMIQKHMRNDSESNKRLEMRRAFNTCLKEICVSPEELEERAIRARVAAEVLEELDDEMIRELVAECFQEQLEDVAQAEFDKLVDQVLSEFLEQAKSEAAVRVAAPKTSGMDRSTVLQMRAKAIKRGARKAKKLEELTNTVVAERREMPLGSAKAAQVKTKQTKSNEETKEEKEEEWSDEEEEEKKPFISYGMSKYISRNFS